MQEIRLKPGREKSVLRGHPWIFSGSIADESSENELEKAGQTVRVTDKNGGFLAWGAISPRSKIRVRVWSFRENEVIGADFFRDRLAAAISRRQQLQRNQNIDAYRLVNAESDGLPGLIVDKYAQILVVQFLTAGIDLWRETIIQQLGELVDCRQVYERSDADVRRLEGLTPQKGILMGTDVVEPVEIHERELRFLVDISKGQKTGFFLDQRENRAIVSELAAGNTILDCFAYTGGFTIAALAGGAKHVLALETSASAIQLGIENLRLNQFPGDRYGWIETDVFKELRKFRDKKQTFDLIILDPPKFAPTAAHAPKASRGYKDINLLAFKLLNPGGLLATFSCSGGVSEDLFQKIIAGAAQDAGVDARILRRLGPGIDHPVALNFPEGAYLKGLILQV